MTLSLHGVTMECPVGPSGVISFNFWAGCPRSVPSVGYLDSSVVIVLWLFLSCSWVGSLFSLAGCETQPWPHHSNWEAATGENGRGSGWGSDVFVSRESTEEMLSLPCLCPVRWWIGGWCAGIGGPRFPQWLHSELSLMKDGLTDLALQVGQTYKPGSEHSDLFATASRTGFRCDQAVGSMADKCMPEPHLCACQAAGRFQAPRKCPPQCF